MESNKKTVMVSGYFDPIHVGHLELIKQAKALGDKLIVVVNNTKQTIDKKGYEFMPINERMQIVQALEDVDEVFESIDQDQSQCASLAHLKPDIFANGGDRHQGNVPETPICKSLNIEMIDGLGAKVQSSSDLVSKSKKKGK